MERPIFSSSLLGIVQSSKFKVQGSRFKVQGYQLEERRLGGKI
jgi:hypothetical protein